MCIIIKMSSKLVIFFTFKIVYTNLLKKKKSEKNSLILSLKINIYI